MLARLQGGKWIMLEEKQRNRKSEGTQMTRRTKKERLQEIFTQLGNIEHYVIQETEGTFTVYLQESVPVAADYYNFLLQRMFPEEQGKIEIYQTDSKTLANIANGAQIPMKATSVNRVIDLEQTISEQFGNLLLCKRNVPVDSAIFSPELDSVSVNLADEGERKLAISDGGNETEEEISHYMDGNLSQFLYEAARDSDNGIVFIKEDQSRVTVSYKELVKKAEKIASALNKLAFQNDRILMFQFPDNQDFLEMFWGCILANIIPVPVQVCDSYKKIDANVNRVYNIWKILKKPPIVTSDSITEKVKHMNVLYEEPIQIYGFSEFLHEEEPFTRLYQGTIKDTALIMFTSGSTGLPKGVKLTHYNLISQVIGQIALNGFTGKDISMNWMPLTHVGGIIYFHLRDVHLKIKQIHVDINVILGDVLRWLSIIDEFRASITWAPNFAFKLITDALDKGGEHSWDLSCMHTFLNGGEAVIAAVGLDFVDNLTKYGMPDTALKPSYGMSETSSGTIYSFDFNKRIVGREDSFVSVGKIIPGDMMRITDENDQLKYEGEIGRFQVKGKTITNGYYNNEKATKDSYTADGWFNTGDLAFIKDDRLTITGREKDVIIINGVNYYNHEIESELEKLKEVKSSFCMAGSIVLKPGDPESLLIIYSLNGVEDENFAQNTKDLPRWMKAAEKKIRKSLAVNFNLFPAAVVCVPSFEILKTDIGKLQRKKMSEQFLAGEYEKYNKGNPMIFKEEPMKPEFIQRIWTEKQLLEEDPLDENTIVICNQRDSALVKAITDICHTGTVVSFKEAESILQKNKNCHVKAVIELEEAEETTICRKIEELQARILMLESLSVKKLVLYAIMKNGYYVVSGDQVSVGSIYNGILKSYAGESQKVSVQIIDRGAADPVVLAREIRYGTDSVVAYRNGLRYIPLLHSADVPEKMRKCRELSKDGIYLVTGATGGLGRRWIAYLTRQVGCTILAIGRRSSEEAFSLFRGEHAAEEQICYYQGDICDIELLEQAVQDSQKQTGKQLAGIFHLAGSVSVRKQAENHWAEFEQHILVKEQIASFQEVISSKVLPVQALLSIKREHAGSFLFLISSINGYFGGASLSAYAAGNSYLTEMGELLHGLDSDVLCVSFSNINGIGMSNDIPSGMKEASGKNGFGLLDIQDVMAVMCDCVTRGISNIFVGLDMHKEHMNSLYAGVKQDQWTVYAEPANLQEVKEATEKMLHAEITGLSVMEYYATLDAVSSELLYGEEWMAEVRQRFSIDVEDGCVLPETETEKKLYAIWAEHTGKQKFSIEDSYFAIGGNSINSFQTIQHMNDVFQVDLSVTEFFQYSSIQELAEYIEELKGTAVQEEETEESFMF